MGGGDELGPLGPCQVDERPVRDGRDGDPGHPPQGVLHVQGRVHLERGLGQQRVVRAPPGLAAALEDAGVAGDDDVDGLCEPALDRRQVRRGVHGEGQRRPAPLVQPEGAAHHGAARRLPQELRLRPRRVVEPSDLHPVHHGFAARLPYGRPRHRTGRRDDHRGVAPGAQGPHVPQDVPAVPPRAHHTVDARGGEERCVDVVRQRRDLLGPRSGLPEPVQRTGPRVIDHVPRPPVPSRPPYHLVFRPRPV